MTINPEDKEKLLERVKRCLMLGDSNRNNSPEEAATAMAMAQKLMMQYNISMSEIQINEMKEEEVVEKEGFSKRKMNRWEDYLAVVIANFCSVGVFNRKSRAHFSGRLLETKLIFFGIEMDVRIAQESYLILRQELINMAKSNGYDKKESKSYCLGVVRTLDERVNEEKEKSKAHENCKAVMVIKNQLIENYSKKKELKFRKPRAINLEFSAYDHGRIDGQKVNMRPSRNQLGV